MRRMDNPCETDRAQDRLISGCEGMTLVPEHVGHDVGYDSAERSWNEGFRDDFRWGEIAARRTSTLPAHRQSNVEGNHASGRGLSFPDAPKGPTSVPSGR